ncbi:hypothetical protein DWE98_21360 [Bosea caraganae]|uniref:Uncharacterized protein n=2 Tax=Bosea caraganae TaxID=2763117 RepID=A0A370L1N4_9HYPH|nr:hypothetical protein DWE98_21360 [Bosea caraganae]
MPPGSEEALQQAKEQEPLIRRMIAQALVNANEMKAGPFSPRARVSSATITGPNVHQDPITGGWAVLFCVNAQSKRNFSETIQKQIAVYKTANGWRLSGRNLQGGIDCGKETKPFTDLITLASELADAHDQAKQ